MPAYVRLSAADRTKYEKFGSNDITSDDDNSDSEFFAEETPSARKTNFKQIMANNIHDKIQAVYQKVDKTQVIVTPIVRKIKQKTSRSSAKNASSAKDPQADATRDSDNDSIGSASDLQKNEDASESRDSFGNGGTLKRQTKRPLFEDTISESVKTCSSSAYHAECESVATNEDEVSRIQIRLRMKKRDRHNESTTSTVIDENNRASPTSEDLLHQFGDRPLLLDDELDYDSSEPTTEGKDEEGVQSQEEPEDLDVFAMAPFKMPLPSKQRKKKIPPIATTPTAGTIWTSTPKKLSPPEVATYQPLVEHPPSAATNVFSTYLFEHESNLDVSPSHQAPKPPAAPRKPPAPQPPASISPIPIAMPDIPKPPTHPKPAHLISTTVEPPSMVSSNPFKTETVTVNKNSFTHIITTATPRPHSEHPAPNVPQTLYGYTTLATLPGPSPQPKVNLHPFADLVIEHNNNTITQHDPTLIKPSHVSLVTVNQSIVLDRDTDSLNTSPRKYVNFSNVAHSEHDCVIVNPSPFSDDDNDMVDVQVLAKSGISIGGVKDKKDKSSTGKYTPLKDKPAKSESHSRVALPALLVNKVKGNAMNYKKVGSTSSVVASSKKDIVDDGGGAAGQSPGTVRHEYQIGFNNMSFEDFPSDQELDILNPSDGASRTKTTPFEVVRNEKMLQEAERKFGSLKRRSNLFSWKRFRELREYEELLGRKLKS